MAKVDAIKSPIEVARGEAKRVAWGSIFESLATVLMGILLLFLPGETMRVLGWVLGVFFIVKGLYQIFDYFIVRGQLDIFNNDLLYGLIAVIVGILFFVMGAQIESVFRILVGIWLIYEALVHANAAVKMGAMKIKSWGWVLTIALVTLALGVCMMLYPGALAETMGWCLIVGGVLGIVGDAVLIRYIDEFADFLTGKKAKK